MRWENESIEKLSSVPLRNGIYKGKEFQGSGAKIINMKELFAYDFIGGQEMKRIELNSSEEKRYLVKEGDLIFARRSVVAEGAGKTSIIQNLEEKTTFESSMIRVRLDQYKCVPLFYYYYFTSHLGRSQVLSLSTGVNVKGIKGSSLNKLIVPNPTLPTQQTIASILSAYDDLIGNNLKRIKLLEEAAQHLYNEWFVNFNFPGSENTFFSEKTGLPDEWEEDFIGNTIAKVKRPGKLKRGEYLEKGKFPVIDQGRELIGGYSNDEGIVISKKLPMVVFGDHTRRVKFVDFPFVCGADGTQLLYPKNEKLVPAYFFLAISNIDLSNYAYARHFKFLKEQKIIIPSNTVLKDFNALVFPLLKQCTKLMDYNNRIKEARDLLLPRLMNRTLEV